MENLGEFIINHWLLWSILVGFIALLLGSVISSSMNGAKQVSVAQAVQLVNQQKARFIDFRDKASFEKEHIADAIHYSHSAFVTGEIKIDEPQKPVILITATGQSMQPIYKQLQQQAVGDIYQLKGGIHAWRDARLPLFN